jgi:hypothetical protein
VRLAIFSSTIGCTDAAANPAAVAVRPSSKSGRARDRVFIVEIARDKCGCTGWLLFA